MQDLQLFWMFFRIGIGTIGGGYAMVPMIQHQIVEEKGWLSEEEFLDILAISQTAPGVFAVNMSQHIGQKIGGLRASILATLGVVLPSFIIILLLATIFRSFRDNRWVEYAFMGIRPVVVALIAAPVFSMAKSAKLSWQTLWIPVLVAGLIYLFDVSPVYVLLAAALMGYLYARWQS
ncbi:MAG: chromate transporter [Porphyromonas sp.]|nr:chromate transporter [Porphyromonas sp.]